MTGRLRSTLRDERGMTIAELAVVALLTGLVGAMIMVSLSTTVRASSLRTSRSRSTDSEMPGRWTLTITGSPVRSRAR